MATLIDLGEDRIVTELILGRLGSGSRDVLVGPGDDSAIVRMPSPPYDALALTIDPCPTPVAEILGVGTYYDWGRLSGLISLSDLAAVGARPAALLCSVVMPIDLPTKDLSLFQDGLHDLCREFDTPIVGGNIREGDRFSATTAALGYVRQERAFLRSGAKAGDALIAVGPCGHFWSAVLQLNNQTADQPQLPDELRTALFRPRPKVVEAAALMETGLVHAAIDCSDGLGEGVNTLAAHSGLAAVLNEDSIRIDDCVKKSALEAAVDPLSLVLSWGDWQLLVAVAAEDAARATDAVRAVGGEAGIIGHLVQGTDSVRLIRQGEPLAIQRLYGSKRFRRDSYLLDGIEQFIQTLRLSPVADS